MGLVGIKGSGYKRAVTIARPRVFIVPPSPQSTNLGGMSVVVIDMTLRGSIDMYDRNPYIFQGGSEPSKLVTARRAFTPLPPSH